MMVGRWRWLMMLGMLFLGLFSLVATSPPPPDYVQLITANNPQEDDIGYYANDKQWFACKDEKVKLVWRLLSSNNVVINTVPSDAFNPKLENKTFSNNGEVELTFLKSSKFTVKFAENPVEYKVTELSQDICAGFPVSPVVGKYKGMLTQTLPQPATLESALQFIWIEEKLHVQVEGRAFFPCTFDAITDQISCIEGDETAPSFKLGGTFADKVFQGNYQGIGETAGAKTSFEGTFSFTKPSLP